MLLRSSESHLEAENLAKKIAEIYVEEWQGPFPYDDCRWLRREFPDVLDDLIPDLDMWFRDIAGYSSRDKKLLKLCEVDVLSARGLMSLSFYEKHPQYHWLERHIDATNTPDLFEKTALAERLRTMLVTLFDLMLTEKFIRARLNSRSTVDYFFRTTSTEQ